MRIKLLPYFFLLLFIILTVNIIPSATYELTYKKVTGVITAYTPSIDETDNYPFINASNKSVQIGDIANNCLALGSRVRIGAREFVVRDRLNPRYGCNHFDVFMWNKNEALQFGKQRKVVEILAIR